MTNQTTNPIAIHRYNYRFPFHEPWDTCICRACQAAWRIRWHRAPSPRMPPCHRTRARPASSSPRRCTSSRASRTCGARQRRRSWPRRQRATPHRTGARGRARRQRRRRRRRGQRDGGRVEACGVEERERELGRAAEAEEELH
jgi:hypothetical protein